jgi:uncharacterized protein involved in exopolysaccharide biosynthesis
MIDRSEAAPGLDFLKRLRYRWLLAASVFSAMFACIAAIVLLLPNKYEARLKVVVKNDRIDPFVGSDKQTQGILNVNDVSEPRINTEIQLLTSSKVLLEVVRDCKLAEPTGKSRQPVEQREEIAVKQLRHELVVEPVRNSNVIEVSYQSPNPERSARVVNSVWKAYTVASRDMHGVPGSVNFFESLSKSYDAQLVEAQQNLLRFRTEHGVVSLPEEQTLALTNAAHIQSQMADSAAEAQKAAAAANHLQREMSALPSSVERDRRSVPNQTLIQQMTTSLVMLQNKQTEAMARYQPGDRILKELETEIARTQAALSQAKTSPGDEVSMAANPAMDVAKGEYIRVSAAEAAARAETGELARQLQMDRASLMALTTESPEYKLLLQRVTELEELDESYHKKMDAARFEHMLDEQQISNLSVVDSPMAESLPSSPKRGMLMVLGMIWSLVVALIVAAVTEAVAGCVRSPYDLGLVTGVPLLATIPSVAVAPGFASFPVLYLSMQRVDASILSEVRS